MEQELEVFFDVVLDPYRNISKWKESNPEKKVVGCFPMYLPEEMFHAAGMLPVTLWESNELITLGHAHYTAYNCAISRSVIDDALKGKLDLLDGVVFYDTCLQAKGLPLVMRRNIKTIAFIEDVCIPGIIHPSKKGTIKSYLLESYEILKSRLESFGGRKITDEALNESIRIYNNNRALLREVYELRRANPGLVKAREILAIVWSSMLMRKEEHNRLLEGLLQKLRQREARADSRPGVVLAGHLCFAPKFEILDLIESVTCVVDDDIFVGWKYCAVDVAVGPNPLDALAERYFVREPHCPSKVDWEIHWGDSLARKAKGSNAKGVIQLMVKFCPPHLTYYPEVKQRLVSFGIPELLVETEHETTSLEPIRTRVYAFAETLQ